MVKSRCFHFFYSKLYCAHQKCENFENCLLSVHNMKYLNTLFKPDLNYKLLKPNLNLAELLSVT